MAKSTVVAAFLLAATAGVGAYGQDNSLVAPELTKPAPGQLLDQDYLTSTGELSRGQAFLKRRGRRRWIARSGRRIIASTIVFATVANRPPVKVARLLSTMPHSAAPTASPGAAFRG